jgi:uncharacterized protein (TIGR02118 family)
MIRVTALYPKTAESHFDMEYYLTKHVPMVKARLQEVGLREIQIDEGLGSAAPDQPPPFAVIGFMIFDKVEDLQHGLALHGAEIMGDIPNFTNVQPQIQVGNIVLGA